MIRRTAVVEFSRHNRLLFNCFVALHMLRTNKETECDYSDGSKLKFDETGCAAFRQRKRNDVLRQNDYRLLQRECQ